MPYINVGDLNLQIPTKVDNIKKSNNGSSKIYWVNVRVPTSENKFESTIHIIGINFTNII